MDGNFIKGTAFDPVLCRVIESKDYPTHLQRCIDLLDYYGIDPMKVSMPNSSLVAKKLNGHMI